MFFLVAAYTLQGKASKKEKSVNPISGNELVSYEKFDYSNQSMTDLGLPEDNYSPSNFYTLSIVQKQTVVRVT